jgi:hypothetical protein
MTEYYDSPYAALKRERSRLRSALFDSTDTKRQARPWCKCAGIPMQRMVIQVYRMLILSNIDDPRNWPFPWLGQVERAQVK